MRRKKGPRIIEALDEFLPATMASGDAGKYEWFYGMVPREDLVGAIGTEVHAAHTG